MLAETIEHESGVVASLHYEEYIEEWMSPRQWDQLGVMYCWHPDYVLGDEQFKNEDGTGAIAQNADGSALCHDSIEAVFRYIKNERKATVVLGLFLLDHSGLSIQAGPQIEQLSRSAVESRGRFIGDDAGWDTSWVGFIFATEQRRKDLGVKRSRDEIARQLRGEVEEYDMFLRGDVYHYSVEDPQGDVLDSCGGFLGFEHAMESLKEALDCSVRAFERERKEENYWRERGISTT